jgi:tellurite resistance protein
MEHTALIYVMVLMSAADSDMTDREFYTMGEIVRVLPVFRDYNTDLLPQAAADCAEILAQDDGLDAVIEVVNESLPSNLRETAYALACDIAAVEGRLKSEEIKLLAFRRHKLDIDRLTAAAIERGSRAHYSTM